MNRTELTPEPITVSSHPSIPLFPPPLPSSFPFLAGLVCRIPVVYTVQKRWWVDLCMTRIHPSFL